MTQNIKLIVYPVKDVGAGMLIAQVKDKNDNILGLRQSQK